MFGSVRMYIQTANQSSFINDIFDKTTQVVTSVVILLNENHGCINIHLRDISTRQIYSCNINFYT